MISPVGESGGFGGLIYKGVHKGKGFPVIPHKRQNRGMGGDEEKWWETWWENGDNGGRGV